MKKADIVEILVTDYREDRGEMKKMTKNELEELLNEYSDDCSMFPNGRDYDAENGGD